ncbi:auxilin-like clathrin-binding protein required for normal clathrin function [Dimargaris cristalligena]|nr:auxilin-like clathrin-binding protein required for normal clathrin function [Dimargaris cristalligena]
MDDLNDLIWQGQPTKPTPKAKANGAASLSSLAAQQPVRGFNSPARTAAASGLSSSRVSRPVSVNLKNRWPPSTSTPADDPAPPTPKDSPPERRITPTPSSAHDGPALRGTFWQTHHSPAASTGKSNSAQAGGSKSGSNGRASSTTSASPARAHRPSPSISSSTATLDPFDSLLGLTRPVTTSPAPRAGQANTQPKFGSKAPAEPRSVSLAELERQKKEQQRQDHRNLEAQWDLTFLETSASSSPAPQPSTPSLTNGSGSARDLWDSASLLTDEPGRKTANSNPLGILAQPLAASPAGSAGPTLGATPISASIVGRTGSPIPMFDSDGETSDHGLSKANDTTLDGLIAELVALGFSVDQSRIALDMTETGRDVARAKTMLLQQRQADQRRARAAPRASAHRYRYQDEDDHVPANLHRRPPIKRVESDSDSVYMPQRMAPSVSARSDYSAGDGAGPSDMAQQLQEHGERIIATANEIGTNVFSKASSLFQMGKDRLQRTFEDIQSDGAGSQSPSRSTEPGVPRWMASGQYRQQSSDEDRGSEGERNPYTGLQSPGSPPSRSPPRRATLPSRSPSPPLRHRPARGPNPPPKAQGPMSLLSSDDDDPEFNQRQEAALRARQQAYYRDQQAAHPPSRSSPAMTSPVVPVRNRPSPSTPSVPPTRASPWSRYFTTPQGSPASAPLDLVLTAHAYKMEGNRLFKLGQFSEANAWYTRAIEALPTNHVLTVPLHNNRASASLKTGDHRAVVADCDTVLQGSNLPLIGPATAHQQRCLEMGWYWWSHHLGETIKHPQSASWAQDGAWARAAQASYSQLALTAASFPSVMPTPGDSTSSPWPPTLQSLHYSLLDQRLKALQRKATALESLEKYPDATAVHQQILDELRVPLYAQGGAGPDTAVPGPILDKARTTAQDGIRRCEKALAASRVSHSRPTPPSVSSSIPVRPTPAPAKVPAGLNPFRGAAETPTFTSSRVQEMRQQEIRRQQEDQQRHQLKDILDARVAQWRQGKEANLRALLASLDVLLWPELGWKKCGLHELVSNAQVKRAYLRAIGKLHPDKLSPTASMEHRMLANSIFSVLNDAWFAFKNQNNM